jgi:hypothetical protein
MRRALNISIVALLALVLFKPASAQVSIGINIGMPEVAMSVGFAPPPLPVYDQPPCPGEGQLWTPGYWAWDDDNADYYWVPGTWVMAPQPGLLWTPAYWGYENGAFGFHQGYWATEVGFYGGINYGFGYGGQGFGGGRWNNGRFMYNTAVVNVDRTVVRNVYIDKTVIVNNNVTHVSFNGGNGGVQARPTAEQQRVAQMKHVPPAQAQLQNRQAARSNPQFRASSNGGKPPVAATARPGEFSGAHVVQAKAAGGSWHPPANPREAARANGAKPSGNAKPGENNRPGANANNRPGENSRPGANNQPGNAASRPNARPEQNAKPGENNRPGEVARPQQNEKPGETARPGQNPHPQQNAQPGANGRPAENPKPQQSARPGDVTHPAQNPKPQAHPDENANPHAAQPARPDQQHPDQQREPKPKPKPKDQQQPQPQEQ